MRIPPSASGTLIGTDPEGDTLTYSISGSIEVDGFTATGTYGTLVVNKTTGAYTYTLDNSDADTGAIAAGTLWMDFYGKNYRWN